MENPVNRFLAFLLLALSTFAVAQSPHIPPGATVYIAPTDGYESYLAAAFVKKSVPVIVVADKGKADYIVTSTVNHEREGTTSASISVTDAHSSQVVFAYAATKTRTFNQIQGTAEACAQRLKEFIEKPKK
jgi:hypothetical protein